MFHKKAKKHRWDVEKYNRVKQVEKYFTSKSKIFLALLIVD